ncbi:MAG: terminase small subunit, partial [Verrucomicrobium sp.]
MNCIAMPVLDNVRHEQFAQRVAAGEGQAAAYQAVYTRSSLSTARSCSNDLMKRPEVQARVTELKAAAAESAVFDLQKAVAYLTEIIETPVGEIADDHRLCQEYTRTERSGTVTERVKMPGKLDALEKLAKLL